MDLNQNDHCSLLIWLVPKVSITVVEVNLALTLKEGQGIGLLMEKPAGSILQTPLPAQALDGVPNTTSICKTPITSSSPTGILFISNGA